MSIFVQCLFANIISMRENIIFKLNQQIALFFQKKVQNECLNQLIIFMIKIKQAFCTFFPEKSAKCTEFYKSQLNQPRK